MLQSYTILFPGKIGAICDLENNAMERGSIAKINLVPGSNMEKIIWWLPQ